MSTHVGCADVYFYWRKYFSHSSAYFTNLVSCLLPSKGPWRFAINPFGMTTLWNFMECILLWPLYITLWFSCGLAVYLQGYANLFNKMHRPSIPPHTVLCTHVIFSGIPKHSHNSGRCFFANLSSVLHSTSLHSSTLNLGNFQYGKIGFDE